MKKLIACIFMLFAGMSFTGCSTVHVVSPNSIKLKSTDVHHIESVKWTIDKNAKIIPYKMVFAAGNETINQFDVQIASEQLGNFYQTVGGIFIANVKNSTYSQKSEKRVKPAILHIEAIKAQYDLHEEVCDVTVIATLKNANVVLWMEAFLMSTKCSDDVKSAKQLESTIIGRISSDGLL